MSANDFVNQGRRSLLSFTSRNPARDLLRQDQQRLLSGASATFADFIEPQRPRIDAAQLSRGREMELAGGSEAEIKRARLFEQTGSETGIIARRALLEGTTEDGEFVEQPTQPTGFLESLTKGLQLGVSASVGAISGLLGLERERETAGTGELYDAPEGRRPGEGRMDLALRRFAEGLSGQEMFRSADFGILAYDRETASTPERAMKATAGFLLDTLVDPLTYMSLGGSIFGRAAGARNVFYSLSNKEARENIIGAVGKMSRDDQVELIMRGTALHTADENTLVANILNRLPERDFVSRRKFENWAQNADEGMLRNFLRATPNIRKEIAADFVAGQGANAYSVGSSTGLRKYLKGELGDVGDTLYKALPLDLQGGIRMRVPFSAMGGKDPKILFRIPGTEKLSGITNGTRQFLRTRMPFTRSFQYGKLGSQERALRAAYYQSTRESAAKIFGSIDVDNGSISWFQNDALRNLHRIERESDGITNGLVDRWTVGVDHLKKATKLYTDAGESQEALDIALDRVMTENITSSSGLRQQKSAEEIFGPELSQKELEVYNAAVTFREISDLVAEELQEVFDGNLGIMFRELSQDGEYWPRIVDEMNQVMMRGKASSKPLFSRENWFSAYDRDGNAIASMTPRQIKLNLEAQDAGPFLVDPADMMLAYIVGTRRVIKQEKLLRQAKKSGLVARGQAVEIPDLKKARDDAMSWYGFLERRRNKLLRVGEISNRETAKQVFDALDGLDRWKEKIFTHYEEAPLPPDALPTDKTFRSIDGYEVFSTDPNNMVWYARNQEGKYLTANGTWTDDITQARQYMDRVQAQSDLDSQDVVAFVRNQEYIALAKEAREDAERTIANSLTAFDDADIFGKTDIYNPDGSANLLNPVNIPVSRQDEYISNLVNIIGKYAELEDVTYRRPTVVGEAYKINSPAFGGYKDLAQLTDVNVSSRMQARFEELGLFAPDQLVEPIQRLFRAYKEPEGDVAKFIDKYYRPFFALQKALMTSQRGPGYVFRNVQGGMWNAWLTGVSGDDFLTSYKVNAARLKAQRAGNRIVESDDVPGYITEFERTAVIMREFEKELIDTFGEERGTELLNVWNKYDGLNIGGHTNASKFAGTASVARAGEADVNLRLLVKPEDITRYENVTDYLTTRTWWAQRMSGLASESEDYLRFAAFLKGARTYGLQDNGLAASLFVKGSQFDYEDLSDFEINVLKMIVPFYTWSRNNIPLQVRAIMSSPGKVNRALQVNETMQGIFAEPDDPEEPLPAYVRERMGWRVRTDLIDGPAGDALAGGILFGEPLVDVNRLYRFGTGSQIQNVNWRELANNLNPLVAFATEVMSGIEQASGGRPTAKEETPGWIAPFRQVLGQAAEENDEISSRVLRGFRQTVPPIATLERIFPQVLGNDRTKRRWYSSIASTIFGLPASTLDPYQTAAELRAEEQRNRNELEKKYGEDYAKYTEFARALLTEGVRPQEMNAIKEVMFQGRDFTEVSVAELDQTAAKDYLKFIRRLEVLASIGIDEDRLQVLVDNFQPRRDIERGVRAGAPQPLTPEMLADMGYTQEQVARMTRGERQELINRAFN
jgi:hypothetical protein